MIALYPLKLPASLREKIWGTTDLRPIFGPQPNRIGEAWFHYEENAVVNGELAGRTLGELVEHFGKRLMGSSYEPSPLRRRSAGEVERRRDEQTQFYFPILSKLLFTSDNLSVQVHPDDDYALVREDGPGKTEMWYIVDAQPGAGVVLGLTKTMTPVALCEAAKSGEIEKQLHWMPVEKGQCLFIAPGTLHTIGSGIVICEIEQNSDLTYRFYDFGRLGDNGKPRPLHVEKAASVTRQEPHPGPVPPFQFPATPAFGEPRQRELLVACRYFAAERLCWGESIRYRPDPARAHLWIVLEGQGRLVIEDATSETYQPGDAFLIPAEAAPFAVEPDAATKLIRAYVPDLEQLHEELQRSGAAEEHIGRLLVE